MSQAVLPEQKSRLEQCESIRGLAILLVFCFHYLGDLRGYLAYPDMKTGLGLLFGGNTGVTLFFLLSGFLITRPFLKGAPLQIRNFLARRALRILPMFYVSILIGAVISQQWGNVLKSMFFYDIGLGTLSPMGAVWWSLVVEVQFYLVLPLLVWLARRPGWRLLLIPLLAAMLYGYMLIRSAPLTEDWSGWRDSIIGRWPVFLTGAALAWVHIVLGDRLQAFGRRQAWVGLVLVVLALGFLVALCDHRVRTYGIFAHGLWYDYYMLDGLAWGLFVFALLNFRFLGYQLFVNPLLHHLGLWSYSLYLLHSGVLFFVLRHEPLWLPSSRLEVVLTGLALLGGVTLLSAITYRYIEQPFLRIRPNWSAARTGNAALAS